MVDQLEAKLKARKEKIQGINLVKEQEIGEKNSREIKENSNLYGGSGRSFTQSIN